MSYPPRLPHLQYTRRDVVHSPFENLGNTTSYSGPYVRVKCSFTAAPDMVVELSMPLSAMSMFIKAKDAIALLRSYKLTDLSQRQKVISEAAPESYFDQQFQNQTKESATAYVSVLDGVLEEFQKVRKDSSVVWAAQINPSFNVTENCLLIHPNDNEKVHAWQEGGAMHELVEMLRFSPLLAGEMNALQKHFTQTFTKQTQHNTNNNNDK